MSKTDQGNQVLDLEKFLQQVQHLASLNGGNATPKERDPMEDVPQLLETLEASSYEAAYWAALIGRSEQDAILAVRNLPEFRVLCRLNQHEASLLRSVANAVGAGFRKGLKQRAVVDEEKSCLVARRQELDAIAQDLKQKENEFQALAQLKEKELAKREADFEERARQREQELSEFEARVRRWESIDEAIAIREELTRKLSQREDDLASREGKLEKQASDLNLLEQKLRGEDAERKKELDIQEARITAVEDIESEKNQLDDLKIHLEQDRQELECSRKKLDEQKVRLEALRAKLAADSHGKFVFKRLAGTLLVFLVAVFIGSFVVRPIQRAKDELARQEMEFHERERKVAAEEGEHASLETKAKRLDASERSLENREQRLRQWEQSLEKSDEQVEQLRGELRLKEENVRREAASTQSIAADHTRLMERFNATTTELSEARRRLEEKPKYVLLEFTHREKHALHMLVDDRTVVFFPANGQKASLTLSVGRHSLAFWQNGKWSEPDYIEVDERTSGCLVH